MAKVIYEGWMVRCGRRKIGRSFMHMRYFVLESHLLAYYKKKPQDKVVPIKTLLIDGNCRVEDRGLKTQHGHSVYVLFVYNKKEMCHRITMAAFNVQEAQLWKEKIQFVIDQQEASRPNDGKCYTPVDYKPGVDNGRAASSSDHESQYSGQEEEENGHKALLRRKAVGNVPIESILDWTRGGDTEISIEQGNNQVFNKKRWRLARCQNGECFLDLEFLKSVEVDYLPRSCSKAMKAVGVVEASSEEIFELIMCLDETRFEWDSCYQYGRLVEEVDGHTAILYQRFQPDWFPMLIWPRDLCYIRYWRRNDDGSYVILFRSTKNEKCGPQPGFVRAHLESGGFTISPLKSRYGKPRAKVQHLMQIDLKGWFVGYIPSFRQHCLGQMLISLAGLREWFAQTDERRTVSQIPMMVKMAKEVISPTKDKAHEPFLQNAPSRHFSLMDDYSDVEEEFHNPETEQEEYFVPLENEIKKAVLDEEPTENIDQSCFSGNLRHDDSDEGRNCWRICNGNNFRVRSKQFLLDKSKIPAGKHLMDLVAVDWFKDNKRMDHVARCQGCAVQVASEKGLFSLVVNLQVPCSTHYSMVFYFVARRLAQGSLLQRFVDGDDEFRNSRLKLIPAVPKGSWIVRQSVGSTPCLLGKAVDCTYIRGTNYLEIDVDIGSSTVANGVLGLVCGVITTLVVDIAFLVQANTEDELPERLIGAVRASHVELSSAIPPNLDSNASIE